MRWARVRRAAGVAFAVALPGVWAVFFAVEPPGRVRLVYLLVSPMVAATSSGVLTSYAFHRAGLPEPKPDPEDATAPWKSAGRWVAQIGWSAFGAVLGVYLVDDRPSRAAQDHFGVVVAQSIGVVGGGAFMLRAFGPSVVRDVRSVLYHLLAPRWQARTAGRRREWGVKLAARHDRIYGPSPIERQLADAHAKLDTLTDELRALRAERQGPRPRLRP